MVTHTITVSHKSKFFFEITRFSEGTNVPELAEELVSRFPIKERYEVLLNEVDTKTTTTFVSRPTKDTFLHLG